jgi:DNA-directed RNA polymerase specialized sigma24 family protein
MSLKWLEMRGSDVAIIRRMASWYSSHSPCEYDDLLQEFELQNLRRPGRRLVLVAMTAMGNLAVRERRYRARLDRYRPPERHPPDRDGMMDLPIYLSMLSDVEREALTLRFRDGLTVASAASRLGLSTSAVVNATHRAIEKIRDRI